MTAGRAQKRHDFMYWELGSEKRLRQAVRRGAWKAVRENPGKPLELFDLSKDIGETKNVAAVHPDVMAGIEAYLKTCREPMPPQIEPEKPKGMRYR